MNDGSRTVYSGRLLATLIRCLGDGLLREKRSSWLRLVGVVLILLLVFFLFIISSDFCSVTNDPVHVVTYGLWLLMDGFVYD